MDLAGFAAIATIVSAVGTGVQALGALQQGRDQKAAYEFEAKQREQQANESRAASQREAQARNREAEAILSRQRTVAAATSGDVTDPSVLDIMGDTAGEADLARRTEIYRGENRARGYQDAAKVARMNADRAMTSARYQALGGVLGGASSMFSRFGQSRIQRQSAPTVAPLYG